MENQKRPRRVTKMLALGLLAMAFVGAAAAIRYTRGIEDRAFSRSVPGQIAPSGSMPSTTAIAGQPALADVAALRPASAVRALDAPPAETGRKVVSSGAVTVRTDDLARAKDRAADLVRANGGDVHQETTSFDQRATSELVLKVPPGQFDAVLEELGTLGTLLAQSIKTEDVTQQVIDLDVRVRTTEASVESVQGFVAESTNIIETAQLENELQRRIAELESLRAQRQNLSTRVDLATIVLTLVSDRGAPGAAPAAAAQQSDAPGFSDGLDRGLAVAGGIARGGAVATGAALPFTPPVLVLTLALRWRRRHQTATTEA